MQKIKKRIWSILIVGLTLLLLLPASALAANNPFTDISINDWYYDEIQYVYDNGIMQGTSATTFNPAASTSRGMIATILYRIEGSPAVSGNQFSDVKASDYFANAVSWAAKNGIVNGYGDGTFKPNQPISREEMAAMVYRYAQYKNYDVSARADLSKYTDASTISSYALTAMQWVNCNG